MDIIQEIFLTFSNQKSFLSSKKVERFAVFSTFLILSIAYIVIHIKNLVAGDFIMIVGTWLGYGGVNSILLQRDKKIDAELDKDGGRD